MCIKVYMHQLVIAVFLVFPHKVRAINTVHGHPVLVWAQTMAGAARGRREAALEAALKGE